MKEVTLNPFPLNYKAKVSISNTCWIWMGYRGKGGYGRIRLNHKATQAHKWFYEYIYGEVGDGLVLDHLCRVHECVNPNHLEPVTPQINSLRGNTVAAKNAAKIHCPQGHLYNKTNTYLTKTGGRACRICIAAHQRKYYARKLELSK